VAAGEGRLRAEAEGEVEKDGKVLVIRRIHVRYRLKVSRENRDTVERVHELHADFCPVARTLRGCVEISTAVEMEDP
jgi:uncharacterized OsmC-like protein